MGDTDSGELVSIVGRETELGLLRRALVQSRVVVVTGPIGVGKSRLVRAEIDARLKSVRRTVVEVRLGGSRPDEIEIVPAVAAQLGVAPTVDAIQRAAPRLIVLDGAEEHLQAVTDFARDLAERTPRLRLVVTSTVVPELPGQQLVPLRPLPRVRGARGEFDLESDAVRLFERSAREVDPYFQIAPTDFAVIAAICDGCGGLPAFIEIAARHVHALSLDQIAALPLATLAERMPGRPTRERVRLAVDRLEPAERRLLRRCGRLTGQITLETLEALGDADAREPATVETITRLVEWSLLVQHRSDESVSLEIAAAARADEEFAAGDDAEDLAALGSYYLRVSAAFEEEFIGPRHDYWRRRIGAEWPMLERCLDVLAAEGRHREALTILARLRHHAISTNREREFVRLLSQLLENAPTGAESVLGRVHLAYFLVLLGREEAAQAEAEDAGRLAREQGSAADPYLLLTEGIIAVRFQRYDDAIRSLTGAIQGLTSAEFPQGHAFEPLFIVGLLCAFTGREREATAFSATSDRLSVRSGSPWGRGLTAALDGVIFARAGRLEHADEMLRQAYRAFEEMGDRALSALALELRSGIEAQRGEYLQAVEHLVPVREERIFFRHIFREFTAPTEAALQEAMGVSTFHNAYRSAARKELAIESRPLAFGKIAVEDPQLSSRELEVAKLISLGHSNPQIAAVLVISRRTVEGHVQRILRKGGFENRTAIGVWYARFEAGRSVA